MLPGPFFLPDAALGDVVLRGGEDQRLDELVDLFGLVEGFEKARVEPFLKAAVGAALDDPDPGAVVDLCAPRTRRRCRETPGPSANVSLL